jgi:hypothetical protein
LADWTDPAPVLIFIFSNKYVFSKIASLVVEERQDDLILPAFDKVLLIFQSNQPDVIQNVADYSFAKLKLINDVKNNKIENLLGATHCHFWSE